MGNDDLISRIAESQAKKEVAPLWQAAATLAILEAIHDLAKLLDPEKADKWPSPEERFRKWNNWL